MLSRDRKVSPISRERKWHGRTLWVPMIRNSFGLPAGETCPGMTEFCESCYAAPTERQWPGVRDGMVTNLRLLQEAEARGGVQGMATLLDEAVDTWWRQVMRHKLTRAQRVFRIHWDGDFYSTAYASAWRLVMEDYPEARFWCYTRSFTEACNVVPILATLPNLSLYLSVDAENEERAHLIRQAWPTVRYALCAEDYEGGRRLAEGQPFYGQAPVVCPENRGGVPLVTDGVGACVPCQLCIVGKRDVLFSTSHVEQSPKGVPIPFPRTKVRA
jgi:hypothetical protein